MERHVIDELSGQDFNSFYAKLKNQIYTVVDITQDQAR